jgi:hypothetical protein
MTSTRQNNAQEAESIQDKAELVSMTNVGFTEGPWTAYLGLPSPQYRHQIVAFGKTVARIYCTKGDETADTANARLIAASPTMAKYIQRKADEGDLEAAKIMETIHARS